MLSIKHHYYLAYNYRFESIRFRVDFSRFFLIIFGVSFKWRAYAHFGPLGAPSRWLTKREREKPADQERETRSGTDTKRVLPPRWADGKTSNVEPVDIVYVIASSWVHDRAQLSSLNRFPSLEPKNCTTFRRLANLQFLQSFPLIFW